MFPEQRPLDSLSTQDWLGPRHFLYPPSAERTSPPSYRSLTESPSHIRPPARSHVPPPFTSLPNRRRRPGRSLLTPDSSRQVSGVSSRPLTSAGRHYLRPRSNTTGGGRTNAHFQAYALDEMSAPDSNPPPYSPTPPVPIRTTSVQRASSSPHLRSSPCTQFFTYSTTPSSSSLPPPHTSARIPPSHSHSDLHAAPSKEGHDLSDTTPSDDDMIYTVTHADEIDTTHSRPLMRKGRLRDRLRDETAFRQITTAHGVPCAGETETEGEDSVSPFVIWIITLRSLFTSLFARLHDFLCPLSMRRHGHVNCM